jgi:hypothetical protein
MPRIENFMELKVYKVVGKIKEPKEWDNGDPS